MHQTATVGVMVDIVNDLFSIPFLLQYNPAVISVEEVRHGGFLQAGDQAIAIVLQVDKEHGQAVISATRQPNTPGASGTGTVTEIKALAPGNSTLSIVQVNRQGLAAAAHPISDQRSQRGSEAVNFALPSPVVQQYFCVPQNGHLTANTAVPCWHRDLTHALPSRHLDTNQYVPQTSELRTLWPP
jgi:hypothetical protein